MSGLLLCSLFITALPPANYLFTQHHLHCKFAIVGWSFLANKTIGRGNTIVCLCEFLKERLVILKQASFDNVMRNRFQSRHQEVFYYLHALIEVDGTQQCFKSGSQYALTATTTLFTFAQEQEVT